MSPRYFVHHESFCVVATNDEREIEGLLSTGEVEEIDEGLYHSLAENGYVAYDNSL